MNAKTLKPNEPNVWIQIDADAMHQVARDLLCTAETLVSDVAVKSNGDNELVVLMSCGKQGTVPVPYRWLALRLKINARLKMQPVRVQKLKKSWKFGYVVGADIDATGVIHWTAEKAQDDDQMNLGDD